MSTEACPDCGEAVGAEHIPECDVARCLQTGQQRLMCNILHDHGADIWTGKWPGKAEADEFGWFTRWTSDGWVECERDHPDARPDLNRLHIEAAWDPERRRWVLSE